MATRGHPHAPFGLDAQRAAFGRCRDSKRPPRTGILADDARHLVLEKNLRTLCARGLFKRAHDAGPPSARFGGHNLALNRPLNGGPLSRYRGRRSRAGCLISELHAVGNQKFKGRRIFVRERSDQISVAVPAFAVVVAHPVVEDLLGRILYSEFLLSTRPTAEVHISPAHHSMSADVEVLLDHDDGRAVLERRHRSGEPRGAGSDRDEVRSHIPPLAAPLGFDFLNAEPQQRARAGTSGTFPEEVSPTDIRFVLLDAHARVLTFTMWPGTFRHSVTPSMTAESLPQSRRAVDPVRGAVIFDR